MQSYQLHLIWIMFNRNKIESRFSSGLSHDFLEFSLWYSAPKRHPVISQQTQHTPITTNDSQFQEKTHLVLLLLLSPRKIMIGQLVALIDSA